MRTIHLAMALGVVTFLGSARAGELLPADRAIEAVVDHYVDAGLTAAGTHSAPETDDPSIVRRLTLDLLGRIPTASEVKAFVNSTDPDKRSKLVDHLMAAPGFARHQADSLDAMMMAGYRSSLRDYLLPACRDNRPWDQIFSRGDGRQRSRARPQRLERVPQVARQGPGQANDRRQLDLLRRERQLCQVPRPPARRGLEAGTTITG